MGKFMRHHFQQHYPGQAVFDKYSPVLPLAHKQAETALTAVSVEVAERRFTDHLIELISAHELQLAGISQQNTKPFCKISPNAPVKCMGLGRVGNGCRLAAVAKLAAIGSGPVVRADRAAAGVAPGALFEARAAVDLCFTLKQNSMSTHMRPASRAPQALVVAVLTQGPGGGLACGLQPIYPALSGDQPPPEGCKGGTAQVAPKTALGRCGPRSEEHTSE